MTHRQDGAIHDACLPQAPPILFADERHVVLRAVLKHDEANLLQRPRLRADGKGASARGEPCAVRRTHLLLSESGAKLVQTHCLCYSY